MVPAGMLLAKATSKLRDAVMRAWPAVIAVIGEVHPRDATMQEELLRLSGVDAFDARYARGRGHGRAPREAGAQGDADALR